MASSLKRLTAECLSLRPLRRRFTTAIASSRPFSTVPHSVEDFPPLDDVKPSVEPKELVIDGSSPVVRKLSKRIKIHNSKTDINIKAKIRMIFPNPNLHEIFPNPKRR